MSISELRKPPVTEKLKIIEALWGDLAADDAAVESPSWHAAELARTEDAYQKGEFEVVDWEEAKRELRKRTE